MDAEIRARLVGWYGETIVARCEAFGIQVVVLKPRERIIDVSPKMRSIDVDVDAWPVPPAGLFVCDDLTMYLRKPTDMTVAHEFGHAIDCMLGGGPYYTDRSPRVRRAFAEARSFVSSYSACGIDEYFAEAFRAYAGVNDDSSPWPKATRAKLLAIDPAMHAIVESILTAAPVEAVA